MAFQKTSWVSRVKGHVKQREHLKCLVSLKPNGKGASRSTLEKRLVTRCAFRLTPFLLAVIGRDHRILMIWVLVQELWFENCQPEYSGGWHVKPKGTRLIVFRLVETNGTRSLVFLILYLTALYLRKKSPPIPRPRETMALWLANHRLFVIQWKE